MSAVSSASSASSAAGSSPITFSGLASGLDTTSIINGLLAVQQQQVTNLQNQQTTIQQQQTAYSTIQADLTALQGDAQGLSSTFSSAFDNRTATSSNTSLVNAAAATGATPGNYTFNVNSIATAEQLTSSGYASPTSAIAQGTLQLQVGSGSISTVTIDNTNDTLQGLADAINAAGNNVTASVLNTGTGATPYELLLTSNKTGAANTINVTNNLTNTSNGGTQPTLNTIVENAGDASIQVGSTQNAVTINSPTNTIDNVFNGVTLNLQAASPNTPVTVTVANDTAAATQAITNFVNDFNTVVSYISSNSTFNSTTNTAGLLLGDPLASNVQNSLTQTLQSVVGNVNGQANTLSAIGITFNAQGELSINSNTLSQALNGQLSGVSANDVRRLFVQDGTTNNNAVSFVYAGSNTQPGSYGVNVTQAATNATLTASNALDPSVVNGTSELSIDSSDNTFTLSVDGLKSDPIVLAAGQYTGQELVNELQSQINADSALAGHPVTVSLDNGKLAITSQSYGSNSQVSIGSGSAIGAGGPLGFLGTEAAATGQDVEGNFIVNGKTEAATGNGQILTGDSGNANTAGLEVNVDLTPSQLTTGSQANITVSNGLASQLNQVLSTFLNPTTGQLASENTTLNNSTTTIQQEITAQNNLISQQRAALVQEFANMETTISQLQTVSSLLDNGLSSNSSLTGSSSNSSGTTGTTSSNGSTINL